MSINQIAAKEEKNKNIGFLTSAIIHLLLSLLCFIIYFSEGKPLQDDVSSIVIVFDEEELKTELIETIEEPVANEEVKEIENKTPNKTVNSQEPQKKLTNSNASAPSSYSTEKMNGGSETVQEQTVQTEAEILAEKQKAEAEERKRKLEESKGKFSSVLGATKKDGNDGNSDSGSSSSLDNLVVGKAKVQDGLKNRAVLFEPVVNENSQKSGIVAVRICVGSDGKVISSNFTQKGSTTTDAYLVKIAERAAKKYVFSSSDLSEQCGNITIDFKLK